MRLRADLKISKAADRNLTGLFSGLLLLCGTIGAQAPGYMGKRFDAGYGFNISPALLGNTLEDRFYNIVHEFYLDAALDSRWTMGLSARIYRTSYNNKRAVNIDATSYPEQPADGYFINGLTVALNFRHYRKRFVAPWGKYFLMSPVVNIATTTYDPYMHVRQSVSFGGTTRDTLLTDFGDEKQRFFHPDLMLGWGRTRVIADRVLIDYGWNFQLLSTLGFITDAIRSNLVTLYMDNYIAETHAERVHGVNRINFFVKVGYLF